MRLEAMDYLCCPSCNGSLEISATETVEAEAMSGALECRQCKRRFEIQDGMPDLNFPESLDKSDREQRAFYDRRARVYDIRVRASQGRLGIWDYAFTPGRSRRPLVKGLELRKNASVLDTGTGTGNFLLSIASEIGEGGILHGSDISRGMLSVAQRKMKARGIRAELLQANGSYLPYRTEAFDAVLHVGGFNTYAEKKRAMDEMYRVAKPGAKIVVCDEGLAPGKEKTLIAKFALWRDKNYDTKPPTELVPDNTEDLKVFWVWQGFSWVIEFRKAR